MDLHVDTIGEPVDEALIGLVHMTKDTIVVFSKSIYECIVLEYVVCSERGVKASNACPSGPNRQLVGTARPMHSVSFRSVHSATTPLTKGIPIFIGQR